MSRKNSIYNALPIVASHYGEKFGVKVVIGGLDAATDGNTIFVPNVPESYPNKDVVWGYLTHEAAHVRHTDFNVWNDVADAESLRSTLLNILEDIRIEKAMMAQFPGVSSDLDATVLYLKETGRFQVAPDTSEPGRVLQAKILFWLRANVLQQPVEDLAELAEVAMQETFTKAVNIQLGQLLCEAGKTQSTFECLMLTDKILKMLNEEQKKEEEKSQGGQSPLKHCSHSSDSDDDHTDSKSDSEGDKPSEGDFNSSSHEAKAAAENIRKALSSKSENLDQDAFSALKAELCQVAELHGDDSYCTVPTAPCTKGHAALGQALLGEVQSDTSKLRSQLMGLVQAARCNRDFAHRRGRKLDTKRVTRILSGDTRIFKKREQKIQVNTAVHVLTDLSESMSGRLAKIACKATLAIALALEVIPGVSPAVTYFKGSRNDPVRSAVRHGQSVRGNAHRFIESAEGNTPMAEGIWYAAYELSKRSEDRKLIMVITDGDPNSEKACHTVLNLCRHAGIETVGIGICHQNVKEFFERNIVINSVDELRNTLFQLMRDKLAVEIT